MNQDFTITHIERIIFVDVHEYPEPKTSFNHDARFNELIFTLSGRRTVHFNGLELEDTPNSIRFIPQGPVFEYVVERQEPGPCIDIFFSTDRPVAPRSFVQELGENSKLASLFQTIFSTWVAREESYRFTCMSLLYSILTEMNRSAYISQGQYGRIKPVADYINRNFLSQSITSQTLESVSQVSYSYLKRLFTAHYGLSPRKYIIQLRLNHACDLLRLERYKVAQIAELCNFSDIYFFSRQFKEYVGITPTQFVKKYRSSK